MDGSRLGELHSREEAFLDLFRYIDVKSYEVGNLRKQVLPHEKDHDDQKRKSDLYGALKQKDPIAAVAKLRPDYYGDKQFNPLELAKELSVAYVRTFHDDGEPGIIEYNPFSGKGSLNGRPVNLRGVNKRIFTLLSNNVNKPLSKGAVWRAAGRRGNPQDTNDNIELNTYITNLRRSLGGLSPQQLRLNQTVELWAVQSLTEETDLRN